MVDDPADPNDVELVTEGYHTELGFLVLALAQLVSFFGLWFGIWPDAFGIPRVVGRGSAAFFLLSGAGGFYLAFRTLSRS